MTNREFLNAIINGTVNTEVIDFATLQLEKLDNKNAARKEKASPKKLENVAIAENLEIVTDEIYTSEKISKMLEITSSKATNILKELVNLGKVVEMEEMVRNTSKRKVKGYKGV